MAKVKEVIGGYNVPGGKGGAAVARACQLVLQNPGIKQGDIHEQAASWAGLNHSTANWLTSPGPKSPAEILWTRKKEERGFRCYPNSLTDHPACQCARSDSTGIRAPPSSDPKGWQPGSWSLGR